MQSFRRCARRYRAHPASVDPPGALCLITGRDWTDARPEKHEPRVSGQARYPRSVTFASLITLPHRAISALRNSSASFGESPTGSLPPFARLSVMSFEWSALTVSAWSFETMAAGVLPGRRSIYHEVAS